MKKIIVILIVVILIILGIVLLNSNNNFFNNSNDLENENGSVNVSDNSIVLYFSATGTTRNVANILGEVSNSNVIEIVPKERYTSDDLDYNKDDTRANREQNDSSARVEIENDIDVSSYDVIYLGYPIWWGKAPKIIITFLENNDLSDKIIIPFCTSGGSSISESVEEIKQYTEANVLDGVRFKSSGDKQEIEDFIQRIK